MWGRGHGPPKRGPWHEVSESKGKVRNVAQRMFVMKYVDDTLVPTISGTKAMVAIAYVAEACEKCPDRSLATDEVLLTSMDEIKVYIHEREDAELRARKERERLEWAGGWKWLCWSSLLGALAGNLLYLALKLWLESRGVTW